MPDEIQEPNAPNSEPVAAPVSPEPTSDLPPQVYQANEPQYEAPATTPVKQELAPRPEPPKSSPPPSPPKPPAGGGSDDEDDDPEERGMLRMSFMEHLEELRSVILRSLFGIVIAFFAAFTFAKPLWQIVSAPAVDALKQIGAHPSLVGIAPMEQFNVIYIKLPLLVAVFLGSPWIFYQIWSFISPGLYKREKRWAVPFILTTAGLFIVGGLFAYYIVFRYGLVFLLGIGRDINVSPMVSIDTYFDLFVNVTLGVGLVFEMPIIIFFLTVLRIASPRFLLRHSRYAILAIAIIAAIVTPTPDAFNMTMFMLPMIALYYVGVFASYLLVLRREGQKFPWKIVFMVLGGLVVVAAAIVAALVYHYHFHFIQKWPFLIP